MSLKYVVDSLEGIPETLHDQYTKGDDGKFHLGVEGVPDLSGDVARLKRTLDKERETREAAEKLAKQFEGITMPPEELRALIARMDGDEETKLVREGKLDQVVMKRTEKLRAEFERRLKTEQEAVEAAKKKAGVWSTRVLDNAIREATLKVNGLHPYAVDDVLLHGRQMFSLDENGNAVQTKDGVVVMGKDGSTPFSPSEWLESMRESKPHWFLAPAAGGGAQETHRQDSGNNSGRKTMRRSAFDALPPQERMAHVIAGGVVVD